MTSTKRALQLTPLNGAQHTHTHTLTHTCHRNELQDSLAAEHMQLDRQVSLFCTQHAHCTGQVSLFCTQHTQAGGFDGVLIQREFREYVAEYLDFHFKNLSDGQKQIANLKKLQESS